MKQGQIKLEGGTTTAILANISSGDFDISQRRSAQVNQQE